MKIDRIIKIIHKVTVDRFETKFYIIIIIFNLPKKNIWQALYCVYLFIIPSYFLSLFI